VSPRAHRPEHGVQFVEANGCRFGYLAWGEGPPVLLLHGFPDTARTWDEIGPALAEAGFRALAPFLRGYAPTAIPREDTGTRTLGEDVVGLVDAFGGRAHVIGHDWGAEAAYAAAALGPERIARMVTVAIPHRAAVRMTPSLVWALRHVMTLSIPGAAKRFARGDYAGIEELYRRWSPTWQWTDADLEPVKNSFAAEGCLDAALGYYRAGKVITPDFMRAPVTVPALSIAGADDPGVRPEVFESARAQFSGGYEVVAIPGGHFCHRESPRAFLDAVIPFLRA
jgi:pimeloyl-ACP methyl ester carboxylesterase